MESTLLFNKGGTYNLMTDKPVAHGFQIQLEFRNVGFSVEGGKPEYPTKNPRNK